MNTQLQQQIVTLQALRQSLLNEEPIMWDEVNAVERDLKHMVEQNELAQGVGEDKPYAAEDAVVGMMEISAKRREQ